MPLGRGRTPAVPTPAVPTTAVPTLAGTVRASGAKRALRDLGMPESGIDQATELALANPYWNPRPLERQALRELIVRAWSGEPPAGN